MLVQCWIHLGYQLRNGIVVVSWLCWFVVATVQGQCMSVPCGATAPAAQVQQGSTACACSEPFLAR